MALSARPLASLFLLAISLPIPQTPAQPVSFGKPIETAPTDPAIAAAPSTIVFVAVAGEEQGLNGSRHLAKLARSEGWQLEAVLNNDIVGGDTTPGATGQDKSAVRVFS